MSRTLPTPRGRSTLSRTGLAGLATAVAVVAGILLCPAPAQAETRREYVNKFVILIDWVTRAEVWVTGHFQDAALCRMTHSIAERHVELARRMTPPPEFADIHPHFLLVMENAERMFDQATAGNRTAYRRHRRIMHEEQRIITELLQSDGHFMPSIGP